jgi:hypothetical protein
LISTIVARDSGCTGFIGSVSGVSGVQSLVLVLVLALGLFVALQSG